MKSHYLALLAATTVSVNAQFPPALEGVTVVKSKHHEGVTISYKEPGICETTKGVKSYSGYVHLPPGLLSDIAGEKQDYPINTFFWFFEARNDPSNAPLSIWLNGGPGGSSLMGLLQENGPCFVGQDSNSTFLNPWSWNNEVNMLYLDQPSQVGFSYDILINGTFNLENGTVTPADFSISVPKQNNTFLVGTFPSQNLQTTANSTIHAAHAIWHFAQTWFFEFPYYKPNNDRISLWTESYGGRYGPAFVKFFQEQNERISNGTISDSNSHYIHLDTLGIVNGAIDILTQERSYADFAFNNTYGIQAYNETFYNSVIDDWSKQGGCKEQIIECQKLMNALDPNGYGNNAEVNSKCTKTLSWCEEKMMKPYMMSTKYGWQDIAHPHADPFPEPYMYGYLSQQWVQKALGVPVNYSASAMVVANAFDGTADFIRPGSLGALAYLLDSGIKVALMYGDRDYCCNWVGGEDVSLAVKYSRSADFKDAGYSPILSPAGIGGQVRQFGNYSYSRVYQAGHEVPSYQPEVSYEIFMRAMFNKDVATGLIPVWDEYQTSGPASTWHIKNDVPDYPESKCYILNAETCTEEQYAQVKNGTGQIKNYMLIEDGTHDEEKAGMRYELRGGKQHILESED